MRRMLSIDQNCHSLWDTVPKLHALTRHGHRVHHCVEDLDAAFTALGARGTGGRLRLARERYYRSGGSDWGAALFYHGFLGRVALEIRDLEPHTGMTTRAVARRLGRTVDELYAELSPSDNWQLIGPSYAGDRDHHRTIADLSVAETAEFVREIVHRARADMEERFPAADSRRRLADWFASEEALADELLDRHSDGRLVDVYADWLRHHMDDRVAIGRTADLFATADPPRMRLLDVFVRHYDRAARLYNEAIEETGVGLRTLDREAGELPFFAALEHAGHRARTGAYLRDGAVHVGARHVALHDGGLPLDALREGGVHCLAGKALVLVSQVRLRPHGEALALPYRGSLYMPAAHALARKLEQAGLLPADLHPIMRVRFGLLDRMADLETPIRLPDHLARAMGRDEVPASQLAAAWADLAAEARRRLESLRTEQGRERWRRQALPELARRVDELDARRRALAGEDPKSAELRALWPPMKELQTRMLDALLHQAAADMQVREVDYWDSRGALMPWCVALGGRAFYDHVVAEACIYPETRDEGAPA